MKANGKADLYFHAYFIEKYIRSLYVLQDKVGSGVSSASKKKSKKGKKSQRAEGEDDNDDDNQSGTRLEEGDDQELFSPGQKIEIFSDKFPFMKRIVGLSSTLSKVIVNIKKFPFHEKMYLKYATEFGQRQTSKKMKYLEEI